MPSKTVLSSLLLIRIIESYRRKPFLTFFCGLHQGKGTKKKPIFFSLIIVAKLAFMLTSKRRCTFSSFTIQSSLRSMLCFPFCLALAFLLAEV